MIEVRMVITTNRFSSLPLSYPVLSMILSVSFLEFKTAGNAISLQKQNTIVSVFTMKTSRIYTKTGQGGSKDHFGLGETSLADRCFPAGFALNLVNFYYYRQGLPWL